MSKSRKALGKGLSALIPSAPPEEEVSVVPTKESADDGKTSGIIAHIELKNITPNPYQPRKEFDEKPLQELSQSIRENGLVQPITVRRTDKGYELISGERRLRACQMADLTHIPAYILQVDTVEQMIELSLIENLQREQLNPIEIAHSYRQLIDQCDYTQETVAQRVGKDRSTVANTLRLLKLPEEIQQSIQKNEIAMGHARALINMDNERKQLNVWKRILVEDLTVREVERAVREQAKTPGTKKPTKETKQTTDPHLKALVDKLQPMYGTKIDISASKAGKGTITFEFFTSEDLERLVDLLLGNSLDY